MFPFAENAMFVPDGLQAGLKSGLPFTCPKPTGVPKVTKSPL
jgi:hypothetical protein